MKFLVDECTGPAVARWLEQQGYDVFSIYDQARGVDDDEVIKIAQDEGRILITNDRGFGEKVFRERRPHNGVVFLRLANERSVNKIRVLGQLLAQYGDSIADRFVVVTETQVRFARTREGES
jgi:predicted nuclease of predicted toxin-antitoxin system